MFLPILVRHAPALRVHCQSRSRHIVMRRHHNKAVALNRQFGIRRRPVQQGKQMR